jgi:phospholipid transport system transporter-binding protein
MNPQGSFDLQDNTLGIIGRLDQHAVPALWATLPAVGWNALDLSRVIALDTAGLALLIEITARARNANDRSPRILNPPAGFAALCAAYRIRPELEEFPNAPHV